LEQSYGKLLKVAIIPTSRTIVTHIRIFGLKKAKMEFLEGIFHWNSVLCHYPIQISIFIITCYLELGQHVTI
jgi:hypothetical protein